MAKQVNVELIGAADENGKMRTPHKIMAELISKYHKHLKDVRVAIAWRYGWLEDADGLIRLGQAKKASDLDRQLHNYDFVILINHEAWNAAEFTEAQMRALIDHELCHCEIKVDELGEPIIDDTGRVLTRLRKHDVEEFSEVVARNGIWKKELEHFAEIALDKATHPLTAL